jgi:hypothetical protein
MNQARLIGLESSSALSSPLARIRDNILLDKPSRLCFVDSCHPGVEVIDEPYRLTFGVDLAVY